MLVTITGSIQKGKAVSLSWAGMTNQVTLLTIAKALGISRTTVSNAYNRPDQLSPARREEILAKARELGYAGPDPRAAACATGASAPSG